MAVLIRRPSAPIPESILDELETHFQLTLPAAYREFLLRTNGGLPANDQFVYAGKSGPKKAKLVGLYGVGRNGLVDAGFLDLLGANHERPLWLPDGALVVGEGETSMNFGKLVLMTRGDDAGKVFFRPDRDDDSPALQAVADDFDAFLESLTHESKKGPKPWEVAIFLGDLDALKVAMTGPKPLQFDHAMTLAVEDGHWEILKFLSEKAPKNDNLQPGNLFHSAMQETRFTLAKSILREREVPRSEIVDRLAASEPVLWHDLELVRMLIDRGADINTDPDAGESPLHCAVSSTNPDAVQLLIDLGADPTVVNDDNRTPLQLAYRLEEVKIAQRLKDSETVWARRQGPETLAVVQPFDLHGITFLKVGKAVTLDEIRAVESEKKLTFPPEYRWLLLQANGSVPSANLIDDLGLENDEDEDEDDEDEDDDDESAGFIRITFFPLRNEDCPDSFPDGEEDSPRLCYSAVEASGWYHDGSEIPKGMLPIAELHGYGYEQGMLLIGCSKKTLGKLYAFDHGKRAMNLTLPELFARLADVGRRPKPAVDRWADAIAANDLPTIRGVLAEEPKMPEVARDGRIPFRMMFEAKSDDAMNAYIESGRELNPLLSQAINFDRTDVIKTCIQRMKKLKKDDLQVLRSLPAVYRDRELIDLLAAKGVKFNAQSKYDMPLAHVVAMSGSLEALQFAIDQKADLNVQDKQQGITALIAACSSTFGDPVAMVTRLLELGVQPNRWTTEGHSALHFAVSQGYVEAAKKLIDAGESLFRRNEQYMEGMSIEQSRKMMGNSMRQAEKMFASFAKEFQFDEEDLPPMPDTSTPQGEKTAEMFDLIGKAKSNMGGVMGSLIQKFQQNESGGRLGDPANAQRYYQKPDAAKDAIAILEAYEKSKTGFPKLS
jgi:ankyrin repeat protein